MKKSEAGHRLRIFLFPREYLAENTSFIRFVDLANGDNGLLLIKWYP
jgi:hypothetical protein